MTTQDEGEERKNDDCEEDVKEKVSAAEGGKGLLIRIGVRAGGGISPVEPVVGDETAGDEDCRSHPRKDCGHDVEGILPPRCCIEAESVYAEGCGGIRDWLV